MLKAKLLLVLAAMTCVLAVSAASASALKFEEPGNAITSTGGSATFTVTGGSVTCTSNTDTGKVTNATEIADEVTYAGCKASIGAATISPCKYVFLSDETAKLVGGCVVKATLCTITPSTTANNNLKKFTTTNLKTVKGSLESEVKANVTGITYAVAGIGCSIAGIKGGSAGTYEGTDTQKGVIVV